MNTILLNTVNLGGGVIIKKGGGGGGVTINNQEKSVDITENGTTEVVADAGFTGLSKVVVNTNVPTSGEGGGSASAMEYWDMTGLSSEVKVNIIDLAGLLLKCPSDNAIVACIHGLSASDVADKITAIGTIPSTKIYLQSLGFITIAELVTKVQFTPTRITEEEFYNLDNGGGSSISFTIDGTSFTAEEGMTWLDFVNSEHSNDDFYTDTNEGNSIVEYQGSRFKSSTNEWQHAYSVIIANEAYHTIQEE